ncbi:unnamed protein product [Spodoptera littoralis]|uniref:Uncharacterized protein n=1 Tax=Spodoptera littoralis TaxID=7109 RepID=A0A9P0IGY6_SPOLI|nr:unnamed protein product [Spodoptera littoralis]CAH1644895.1 unnamed protein product [Spodoptera littoralis]
MKFASSIDPHRTCCHKMRLSASFYLMCGCYAMDADITGYIAPSNQEHNKRYFVKFAHHIP